MNKSNFKNLREALARVQTLLDEDRASEAAEMLRSGGLDHILLKDAYGVCLMRCGKLQEALTIYQGACMSTSVCMKEGLPTGLLVNYATALLLSGNASGGLAVLREIRETSYPAAVQLKSAIDHWRRSLSLVERIRLRLGDHPPGRPIVLPFPPGALDGQDGV